MSQLMKFEADGKELGNTIRHYWSVKTSVSQSEAILMPMDHVDLIMAPAGTFEYYLDDQVIVPDGIHFHGIRLHSVRVKVLRKAHVWGVSFHPWGFNLLLNMEMKSFSDEIYPLHQFFPELSNNLAEIFDGSKELDHNHVKKLDQLLKSTRAQSEATTHHIAILRSFVEEKPENISVFCRDSGISMRHLERLFDQCIGVSPKTFLQICRFESSTREMIFGKAETDLTEIGYKSGFYDQAHFIKQFKKFTDFTPRKFRINEPAVKSRLLKAKTSGDHSHK